MGKFVDLTGKTFGELTVIERDKEKPRYWICRCSCGKEKSIQGYSLTNGLTKTCGHSTTGFKDITGQQFNEWTALKYKGKGYWECRCSCGKIKDVQKYYLENNISRSCGHDKEEHYQDLIGKTFGKLTVLRYIGNKQYICKCICGNESVVFKHNLISGGTSSCGCSRGISKDEILEAAKCFEESNGIKPFTDELASILEVSETHLSKLIIKYEIKEAINNKFSSKYEKLVYDWVKESVNIDEIILHDRKLLEGIELDIYIPSKKLAIEINGDYWHSELYKDIDDHQHKTLECIRQNIHLIHIFEHELKCKEQQIKNYIKNKINDDYIEIKSSKIKVITKEDANTFLSAESISSYTTNAHINIGCFKDNTLIGVLTANIDNNICKIENICWKTNIRVMNGTDKLINYLISGLSNIEKLEFKTDITKFTSRSLLKYGFNIVCIGSPNYKWYTPYSKEDNIICKEDAINKDMYSIGYIKIFDSGTMDLVYNIKK